MWAYTYLCNEKKRLGRQHIKLMKVPTSGEEQEYFCGGRKGMDQGQRLAGSMSYLFLLLSANPARWQFPDSLAVKYGHVTKFWPTESGQRMPSTFPMGSPPCPFLPLQSGSYVSRWQSHREELSSCISLPGWQLRPDQEHWIGLHESKNQLPLSVYLC